MSTVEAYPVAEGYCPHCGGKIGHWPAFRIVAAIREYARVHGSTPPAWLWAKRSEVNPSSRSALDMFGTWANAVRAAGLEPKQHGGTRIWTNERVIAAIQAWAKIEGRPPAAHEWRLSDSDHPTTRTVLDRFGSWNAAIAAAGLSPRAPHRPPRSERELSRTTVVAHPVAVALREYGAPQEAIAELAGISVKRVNEILLGQERIELTTADRILTAISRPDVLVGMEAA